MGSLADAFTLACAVPRMVFTVFFRLQYEAFRLHDVEEQFAYHGGICWISHFQTCPESTNELNNNKNIDEKHFAIGKTSADQLILRN